MTIQVQCTDGSRESTVAINPNSFVHATSADTKQGALSSDSIQDRNNRCTPVTLKGILSMVEQVTQSASSPPTPYSQSRLNNSVAK